MFAVAGNSLINLQSVSRISANGTGSTAVLHDGSTVTLDDNIEVLEAMKCPLVPASPGFFRVVHRFGGDPGDYEKQPVIAWRIRTPFAPEPITPEEDMMADLSICEGVLYPDGHVIIGDTGRFADINAWLDHAAAERAGWDFAQEGKKK